MDLSVMAKAIDGFEARLRDVTSEQWKAPTPCADWDVRTLVNHVVGEVLWITPLVEGTTIAEVGDRFDGDVLGDDALATLNDAATKAQAAAGAPGAQERIVHLSFGDFPAGEYLGQVTSDIVVHTWDLAKALGGNTELDPGVVRFVVDFLTPQVELWRSAGAFGAAADPGPNPTEQDRFIAQTGRSPSWSA